MAFASIYVPNFMVQAVVSAEADLRGRAIALLDGKPPVYSVVAMNELAAKAGVQICMAEFQAAQFGGVEVKHRSRAREAAIHAALLDLGWSVSPRIEDTAPDTIVLDLAGLHSVFGSDKTIANELMRRASTLGLQIHVGISVNVEVAIHAARGFPGITVVPPGAEARVLASLPVKNLFPPAEIFESLERWGVRTCADLAALPVAELSERLGQEGVLLHELARGGNSRALVLTEPCANFAEEIEPDDSVEDLEPLAFLLGRLLDQLCARLQTHSLAVSALHLRFDLRDAFERESPPPQISSTRNAATKLYENTLRLPVPMCDPKLLLKLLRLQLQADPPQASIRKIRIGAEPARRRAAQRDFFQHASLDPEKLELTIARLSHLVGNSNVGTPEILDTHRPGVFRIRQFHRIEEGLPPCRNGRSKAVPVHENQSTTNRTTIALRIFRPEWPAKIETREKCPEQICFRGLRGTVLAASGPWRSSGAWWREDAWFCEEWDIHVCFHSNYFCSDGNRRTEASDGVYRIVYDSMRQGWYVRGRYD